MKRFTRRCLLWSLMGLFACSLAWPLFLPAADSTVSAKVYRDQGGDRMTVASGGSLVVAGTQTVSGTLNVSGTAAVSGTLSTASGAIVSTADGVGAVGTTTGITLANELGVVPVHKTVITLTAVNVDITKGSNAGYGSVKLYDWPAGAIQVLGALVDTDLDVVGNGTKIGDTADGDIHLGTTAQSDVAVASIVATEHNILATAAVAQLVGGVGPANSQGPIRTALLDGTSTAKDVYLNLLVDAADIASTDAFSVTGTVTIYWINLGDY